MGRGGGTGRPSVSCPRACTRLAELGTRRVAGVQPSNAHLWFRKGPVACWWRAGWSQYSGSSGSREAPDPGTGRRPRSGDCSNHPPSSVGRGRTDGQQPTGQSWSLSCFTGVCFPDSGQVCFNPPKEELSLINKRTLKMVEKNVFSQLPTECCQNRSVGTKIDMIKVSEGVSTSR